MGERGKTMLKFFDKLWKFIKGLVTRPGLQQFLSEWLSFAVKEAEELLKQNNNAGLKEWEQEFFARLKSKTGEVKDNWIAILVHIAYEELKARGA